MKQSEEILIKMKNDYECDCIKYKDVVAYGNALQDEFERSIDDIIDNKGESILNLNDIIGLYEYC